MVSMNGSVFESLGGVFNVPFRPLAAGFIGRKWFQVQLETPVYSTSNCLDTPSAINI